MPSGRRVIGFALLTLSAISVIQTAREFAVESHARDFDESKVSGRRFAFGGHTFTVTDDQPIDSTSRQKEFPGRIQLFADGKPLGDASRAGVRRGIQNQGRYHTWFDAWIFRERATNDSTLWLTRRIPLDAKQQQSSYEITVVSANGTIAQHELPGWRLGFDYRTDRSTQFLQFNEWTAFPLSLDFAFWFPLILLVYPVGSTVLGVDLVRKRRPKSVADG